MPQADRNLLFGMLALQNNFIDRRALVEAFDGWVEDKSRTIGDILVLRGHLSHDRRKILDALLEEHLKEHGGDAEQSLVAVASATPSRDVLEQITDPDVQQSLIRVPALGREAADRGDVYATCIRSLEEGDGPGMRYRILRPHAKGGLGQVSIALDEELKREVAFKEIRRQFADHPESRARFVLEAEITGGLEHPGIIPVYGLGTYPDGRPYYAMRFIRGDTLKDAIDRFHGKLPHDGNGNAAADSAPRAVDFTSTERAVEFRALLHRFIDVCNAVEYAHSRGILHRDLKPGNVMLGKFGETLVVDWGLAKPIGQRDISSTEEAPLVPSSSGSSETLPGTAIGTPQYMSPEQAAGRHEELGRTSDVYSLGATLYHLLAGQPPFASSERDVGEVLRRVQRGDFPLPTTIVLSVPAPLEAVCLKAMALRPGDRYASPLQLANDLEHWLADEPVSARRDTVLARLARWERRHSAIIRAGGLALLLVVIVSQVAMIVINGEKQVAIELAREKHVLAESEKAARSSAEQLAHDNAQLAAKEHEMLLDAQRQAASLRFQQSWVKSDEKSAAAGLLEMVDSLDGAIRTESPALERSIRRHLSAWHRRLHLLKGVVSYPEPLTTAAFSPDGTLFITGAADGVARIWSAATGDPVGPPLQHEGRVTAVAWHPNGDLVATASTDGTARLWNARTGDAVASPLQHEQGIAALAFSPDGRSLATAGEDGQLRLWVASTGAALRAAKISGPATSLAFSPDSRQILCGGVDKAAYLWTWQEPESLPRELAHRAAVLCIAFAPDGRTFATGGHDGIARVWTAATGQPHGTGLHHRGPVLALAYSADSRALITGSDDNTARCWEAETGRILCPSLKHEGPVTSVAYSPDGRYALTASEDNTARLWEADSGRQRGTPLQHERTVAVARFSPDGKTALTAGDDGSARLWEVTSRTRATRPLVHPAPVHAVAYSPDSTIVLTGCDDKAARFWDGRTGEPLGAPVVHTAPVLAIAFSPTGDRFATATRSGIMQLWSVDGRAPTGKPVEQGAAVTSLAWSADGKLLLTGCADGVARLWDVATMTQHGPALAHEHRVLAVAFSPEGNIVATAGEGNVVRLWNVADGLPVLEPLPHQGRVYSLQFSPDGKLLATGSEDNLARLWNTATGARVGRPLQHLSSVLSLAFSSDSELLLTGGQDQKAWMWEVSTRMTVGLSFYHQGRITCAAGSPDGRTFLTASDDATAQLWHVPTPLEGTLEQLRLLFEVSTGMTLDQGTAVLLKADEWRTRQRQLSRLGDLERAKLAK